MVVEKTPESPLNCNKIKPVNLKEINSGRSDAEDEAPILWPPKVKSRLIGNYPDAGKG